ncbi:MAG: sigma factor [Bacteroidota bacterium]
MTPAHYTDWLAVARRHSRVASEAEDLLHDALIIAAAASRLDLDDESNRRWLTGVIRNQAAFRARSAVRRRQREAATTPDDRQEPTDTLADANAAFHIDGMPPSARRVLVLALHGLRRDEICAVLGISGTAFRQRLVTVRRRLGALPESVQREALALAYARRQSRADDLALGLIRRALLARTQVAPGIGTHDPDGHLLVIGTPS